MKTVTFPFLLAASCMLSLSGVRADSRFSIFKMEGDGHDLRTSDGRGGALRVEYMILEPSTRRVTAAVVTGGVVGDKLVMVPFKAVRFEGSRDIVLTDIPRERLVEAPEIEKGRLTSTAMMEASVIDHCYSYFGVDRDAISVASESSAQTKHAAARERNDGADKRASRRHAVAAIGEEEESDDRLARSRRSAERTASPARAVEGAAQVGD